MRFVLGGLSCACAFGDTNDEVLANALAGKAPGMRTLSCDVPSRAIRFGMVPCELPEIGERRFDFRSCRLLKHVVGNFRGVIDSLLKKYGAGRIAVVLGASNTGIDEAQSYMDGKFASGKIDGRFDYSMIELGTPAEYLAAELGTGGPAYVISTACSSSAKAFSSARRLIEAGIADAAIVGGVDGRCRFAMNGFSALGALAAGDTRPLAADRDGIVLGEGVALFTMEREDRYVGGDCVFFAGAGETSDAYHATAPDPDGYGAERAMRDALDDAGLSPDEVDYVNLHGTGTVANDAMEAKAVMRVLGAKPLVASTKWGTGHCLGAAGAIEAALGWLMLKNGCVIAQPMPETLCDEAKGLNVCAVSGKRKIGTFLSNSFAFGGSNACIVLAK